jgi:hypothetical protein
MACMWTLVLSKVRVQCPIGLLSVVAWFVCFTACCSGFIIIIIVVVVIIIINDEIRVMGKGRVRALFKCIYIEHLNKGRKHSCCGRNWDKRGGPTAETTRVSEKQGRLQGSQATTKPIGYAVTARDKGSHKHFCQWNVEMRFRTQCVSFKSAFQTVTVPCSITTSQLVCFTGFRTNYRGTYLGKRRPVLRTRTWCEQEKWLGWKCKIQRKVKSFLCQTKRHDLEDIRGVVI